MSKITSINTSLISAEYGNGKVFGQPKSKKTIALIRIKSDHGLFGIGETYAGIYSPELIEKVVDFLKPYILGKKIESTDAMNDVRSIPFISSNGLVKSVISGIEIAYFDLLGKILKKPIYEILNPKQKKTKLIKTYCSGGSVIFNNDEIKREIEDLNNYGHIGYKMRVGYFEINKDLKRIETARKVLGNKKDLMIDAIMGTHKKKWNIKNALKFISEIKEYNPTWLEEPLNPVQIYDMSILQKNSSVDLAFGESFTSFEEFNLAALNKSSIFLQPDVTHCGFIDAERLVKSKNILNNKIVLHVWGSKISLLANLHFAIAFNNKINAIEIPNVKFNFLNDKFEDLTNFKNGKICLNDNIVGLGLDIKNKDIKKHKFIKSSGFRIK